MAGEPKKYGLILKNKSAQPSAKKKVGIFDDLDDEDEFMPQKAKTSETAGKIRRQDKSEIAKALTQDKSVYQYDEIYDKLQKAKDEAVGKTVKQDKDKKPKYIGNLLKAAEKRQQEYEARVERQQLKEREKEGDMFVDKEVFVTKAYRDKMEQIHEYEKEEQRREMIEGMMDVTKQANISGFYRHLLNDTLTKPVEIKQEEEDVKVEVEEQSLKSPTKSETKEEKVRTIYDSDSGAEDRRSPEEPQVKPGLRLVKKESNETQSRRRDSDKQTERRRGRSRSTSTSSRERSSHKRRRDKSVEKHRRRRSSSRSSSGGRKEAKRMRSKSPRRPTSYRRRDSPERRYDGESRKQDRSRGWGRKRSVSKSPVQDRSRDRGRKRSISKSPIQDRSRDRGRKRSVSKSPVRDRSRDRGRKRSISKSPIQDRSRDRGRKRSVSKSPVRDRSRDRGRKRSLSKSPVRERIERRGDDKRRRETSRSPTRNGNRNRYSSDKNSRRKEELPGKPDRGRDDTTSRRRKEKTEDSKKIKEEEPKPEETADEKRLRRLTEIFAHRNTDEQIEEYRQRYFQRKAAREAGLCA